jgi:ribosomal protein S18 acetylase RimI-like enzyme
MFVRTAMETDLPAIRRLLVETWHATYDAVYGVERVTEITDDWHSIPALRQRLERPWSEFIVADDGTTIGGMAYAESDEERKTVTLRQLYVLPQFQGRGIGGMLMDEVLNAFADAEMARLEVEAANERAVDFYKAFGFNEAGRTSDCGRKDSGIPALVFERRLGTASA